MPICSLYMGFAMAMPLIVLKNTGNVSLMTKPQSTCVHQHLQEKVSFQSVNCHTECQIQQNIEKEENIFDIAQ